jgi:hypothetical protein
MNSVMNEIEVPEMNEFLMRYNEARNCTRGVIVDLQVEEPRYETWF